MNLPLPSGQPNLTQSPENHVLGHDLSYLSVVPKTLFVPTDRKNLIRQVLALGSRYTFI